MHLFFIEFLECDILNSMITVREQAVDIISQLYPFSRLSADILADVVDHNPIRRVKKGKIIFENGEEAAAMYIVIHGTVGLNGLDSHENLRPIMALNAGEVFGIETIQEDYYQAQAVAWSDCFLLELSYSFLENTALTSQSFKNSLLFLTNSLTHSSQTNFPWRNLEENILYANRRHWIFLISRLIVPIFLLLGLIPLTTFLIASKLPILTPLLVAGIALLFIIGYVFWVVEDWRNDFAVITNQRVVWQEKVILLYESRQEAPLDSVLAVSVQTSALGRMFSYGNVMVRTYAGIIHLPQVPYPAEVAALLESQWEKARRGLVKADQYARVEQMIKERLFHTAETVQIPVLDEVHPEALIHPVKKGLFDWLADLFQLRSESKGLVQYRTHWWILLRRTSLPGLVILILFVAKIFSMFGVFTLISASTLTWLLLLIGGLCAIWVVYEAADWRNDVYIISDEYLIDVNKKPLGMEQRKTAPLRSVQSVEFERLGLAGLLLNFGTVSIRVGETTLTFDHVYNPSAVQRELFQRISDKERARKQKAIEEEEDRLTDWIEVYHHLNEKRGKEFTENI
jgi:hypothetical protein